MICTWWSRKGLTSTTSWSCPPRMRSICGNMPASLQSSSMSKCVTSTHAWQPACAMSASSERASLYGSAMFPFTSVARSRPPMHTTAPPSSAKRCMRGLYASPALKKRGVGRVAPVIFHSRSTASGKRLCTGGRKGVSPPMRVVLSAAWYTLRASHGKLDLGSHVSMPAGDLKSNSWFPNVVTSRPMRPSSSTKCCPSVMSLAR
mmetsp:Transcript_28401/g.71322  ORF Transcript_28401/g.71322 Transcript_28401/m.71322 type:complete len:204 (-) Transcript_28401:492-1103(-)